jgi:hypothetical protein
MKAGTRHLLLKLISAEITRYENAIYSTNIQRVRGYEQHMMRLNKKITDLEKARADILPTPASKEDKQ